MMDSLAELRAWEAWILFLVIGVSILLPLGLRSARIRSLNLAVSRVVQRVGGTFEETGMLTEPSVELTLAGRPAWMEFYSGRRFLSPYTCVVVNVRGVSPGTLHIVPQGFAKTFLSLLGWRDLPVGDPDFDGKYSVQASPESLVAQVFRQDRRHQSIATVLRLRGMVDPTIDLDRETLTVRTRELLTHEAGLIELIKTAEEFTGYILQSPADSGIRLEEVRISTEGECPVCATGMKGRILRCKSCGTPHHAECWTYIGRCSVFACRSKEFDA
jgi:hypothetical protein